MNNESIKKAKSKEFIRRVKPFGFKQTELAILFRCKARTISFYFSAERNIPPWAWVRLEELEKTPMEELCRLVVKGNNRKHER